MPKKLSGIEAAEALGKKLEPKIKALKTPPSLCVIQVGDDPASNSYIKQKQKIALRWGFKFKHSKLSSKSTVEEIKNNILLSQEEFDGVILQLPLDTEKKISAETASELLNLIRPEHDADGLHAENLGKLLCAESTPDKWTSPLPATALGVIRMLDHYNVNLSGEDICMIGKSRLVGMPLSILLMHRGSTVSVCHSKTRDLKKYTHKSKIIVCAAGSPSLIKSEHLDSGQVVIDVGTTLVDKKLKGDLSSDAREKVEAYSPVPGGVGPMTVAALMENCYRLAAAKENIK